MARPPLLPLLVFCAVSTALAQTDPWGDGPIGYRVEPEIPTNAAPAASALPEGQGAVAVVLFHDGKLDLDVEEGGVRSKARGVLRIPLDGREHRMIATYTAVDGAPDTYTVVSGPGSDGAYFVRVERNGDVVVEDSGTGGNLLAEVEDTSLRRTSGGGFGNFSGGSNWLGYGTAARWRLRSVPAGAQVSILNTQVSTDVDVARLEGKYIRALRFSKPGYQACSFAEARITEEETAGLPWNVVTCVLKKAAP